ncbi:MAG: hypothetical protein MJH09_01455 [Cetobacterium sp.]|nr:hypothetical protein [Cetobacterium sp.]
MKKYILFGFFTLSSLALAIDLDTSINNSMLESGMRGFEIEGNFIREQLDNKNNRNLPLFEKYSLINANNSLLNRELEYDNLDRENIYKVGFNRLNINKSNINEVNLLYGTLLDENERVGIALNLANSTNKYNNLNLKGKFYQLNLFYNNKDIENSSEVFSTVYLGYSKDKKNEISLDNKFVGFYGKYTKNIETDYDLFTPKYYFEGDFKRLQVKEKPINNKNKNNDSINVGTGLSLEKEISYEELLIKITPYIGYNKEFLDKRIYKSVGVKDNFEDQGKIGIKISGKYEEVIEIFTKLEVKKSLNTSNTDTVGTIGFKINL